MAMATYTTVPTKLQMNRGTACVQRPMTCKLNVKLYMFGALLAMMLRAKMTMQNSPKRPREGRSTAPKSPPIRESRYESAYGLLKVSVDAGTQAVATARPKISANSSGNNRPPYVHAKTLTGDTVEG